MFLCQVKIPRDNLYEHLKDQYKSDENIERYGRTNNHYDTLVIHKERLSSTGR
jgi:hypothetical protein